MPTRTFLALDLDEGVRRKLAALQRELDAAGAVVRWTQSDQIHVTMKFLGDVADEDLAQVCAIAQEAAAEVEAFDFAVAGVVSSPPDGHMRMVWVNIQDPTGLMAELNRRLEEAYSAMGFKAENRRFHPHLTLGRVKSGRAVAELRQAILNVQDAGFCLQPADELIVYGSDLRPDGPIYTPLATLPLG
jgi:2'-5' RNA ligase